MKIINGEGLPAGRLASYVVKEALKGEEISIINCGDVIITGNKKTTEKDFHEKRNRVGSVQKGPRHAKTSTKIVKRIIRGMLPEHRWGRGKEALKKIICYEKVPKELEGKETETLNMGRKIKYSKVKEFTK